MRVAIAFIAALAGAVTDARSRKFLPVGPPGFCDPPPDWKNPPAPESVNVSWTCDSSARSPTHSNLLDAADHMRAQGPAECVAPEVCHDLYHGSGIHVQACSPALTMLCSEVGTILEKMAANCSEIVGDTSMVGGSAWMGQPGGAYINVYVPPALFYSAPVIRFKSKSTKRE